MGDVLVWRQQSACPSLAYRRTGLSQADIANAQRARSIRGNGWMLHRHEDYDGTVSLVISAEHDTDDAAVFALHADVGLIQAAVITADTYAIIGCYLRIEEALAAVARVLRDEPSLAA